MRTDQDITREFSYKDFGKIRQEIIIDDIVHGMASDLANVQNKMALKQIVRANLQAYVNNQDIHKVHNVEVNDIGNGYIQVDFTIQPKYSANVVNVEFKI